MLAYLTALGAAAAAVAWLPIASPYWRVAAADALGTLVVFGFSRAFDNSSFYDPYWSVAPIAIAWYWFFLDAAAPLPRRFAVAVLVTLWGVRLTYNWLRHWRGIDHEDWRYVDLRRKTGAGYWLVSLFGLHLFPTVQVLLGCLGLYVALVTGSRPLGWLDAAAAAVTAGAVALEAAADRQLHRFVQENDDPQRILDTGVWAWSRHPNYLGEVLFWWGVALFALAADPKALWVLIGPAAITVMFLLVSIPLLEKRMLDKRPHYAAHQRRVPALVPWFPRRARD